MNDLLETLIEGTKKLLCAAPLFLLFCLALYSLSDISGREQIDSLILQTPAKGFFGGGFEYYPKYLDSDDVVIRQKTFIDENGNEYTGAVIELRKPVVFATPRDTGSMQPMFGAGNMLVQEVVNQDTELKTGDIIVYEHGGQLIIHQIVGEVEGAFITKGLNNSIPDSVLVTRNMVKYRLIFAIPTA